MQVAGGIEWCRGAGMVSSVCVRARAAADVRMGGGSRGGRGGVGEGIMARLGCPCGLQVRWELFWGTFW